MYTYAAYPTDVCEDIVRLRRLLDKAQLPPRRTDDNLLVGTWNLRSRWSNADAHRLSRAASLDQARAGGQPPAMRAVQLTPAERSPHLRHGVGETPVAS